MAGAATLVQAIRQYGHLAVQVDPLGTADYYPMAGFFYSSRILEKFAAPTAGESLIRIKLYSPEEQMQRDRLGERLCKALGEGELQRLLDQGDQLDLLDAEQLARP